MKKNLFIFPFIFIISFSSYSQVMSQRIYHRDSSIAYGGQQTPDGGYIMAGLSSVTSTDLNFMAVKTNSVGDTLWTKTYGGIGDEECYAMQQTSDLGYIFIGIDSSSGLGSYNVYVVKTNANGDTLWTKSYGGSNYDFGQAVQQTTDGGYIIAGYTGSFGPGDPDIYLLKIDASGNLTWSKTYGGIYGDKAWAVRQTSDGGYIVAGITSSFGVTTNGTYNDIFLLKTTSTGNLTWSKTYGRDGDDWGYGVVQTYDGGYAITGLAQKDSLDTGSEVYLIKTDAIGDTLYTKTFNGTNYDQGLVIIQTNDSGLAIAGSAYSYGYGSGDLYLIKTNKSGGFLFASTFGGNQNDFTYAMGQTADSGFAIMGYTRSFGVDSSSFYLVKTDKNGSSYGCNQTNPIPTTTNGVAIIGNPTPVVGAPATITANNTHTQIKSGVTIINPCLTAGIKQTFGNNNYQVVVYPNPANTSLTLTLSKGEGTNAIIYIYDILGKLVIQHTYSPPSEGQGEAVDISDVSAGVYQVRILSGSELIYQTKIIKE
ncbi:MAG: T9SS type A sorting domain-containing protein [Bacteroidia bacterium]